MKIKLSDYFKQSNEKDIVANKYVFRCLTCEQIVVFIVLLLCFAKIFLVNKSVTIICTLMCSAVYLLVVPVRVFADMSKKWVKYYLLLIEVIWITIVSTMMTFHAILACVMPIVSAAMFSSRKTSVYTYVLMVISTIVSVFVGYRYGICDTNMVLLSGEPLSYYVNEYNEFTLNTINNQEIYSLSLFFVLPRCIILAAYVVVCNSITKVLNKNIDYAHRMEVIAEKDGMTGLFNRSKYLQMSEEVYKKMDRLGVIFWDINFLKKINDSRGHELGDKLICTVADSFKGISREKEFVYRIGGDEFVMVMPGADEGGVLNKISEWKEFLADVQESTDIPLSVSVGYAFGKGADFDVLTKEADKMMYENKKIMHDMADLGHVSPD